MPSSTTKTARHVPDRRSRRHPRYRTNFPVSVGLLVERTYQKLEGHCRDVSEAGIGILLAAELAAGDVVSLSFALPDAEKWDLRAVVRHRRGFQYGFEFLSLSAEQKRIFETYMRGLDRAD